MTISCRNRKGGRFNSFSFKVGLAKRGWRSPWVFWTKAMMEGLYSWYNQINLRLPLFLNSLYSHTQVAPPQQLSPKFWKHFYWRLEKKRGLLLFEVLTPKTINTNSCRIFLVSGTRKRWLGFSLTLSSRLLFLPPLPSLYRWQHTVTARHLTSITPASVECFLILFIQPPIFSCFKNTSYVLRFITTCMLRRNRISVTLFACDSLFVPFPILFPHVHATNGYK